MSDRLAGFAVREGEGSLTLERRDRLLAWPFPAVLALLWLAGLAPAAGMLILVVVALIAIPLTGLEVLRAGRGRGMARVQRTLRLAPAASAGAYREAALGPRLFVDGHDHALANVRRIVSTRTERTYPTQGGSRGGKVVTFGIYLVLDEEVVQVCEGVEQEAEASQLAERLRAALHDRDCRVDVTTALMDPFDGEMFATVPALVGGTLAAVLAPSIVTHAIETPWIGGLVTAALLTAAHLAFRAVGMMLAEDTRRTRAHRVRNA